MTFTRLNCNELYGSTTISQYIRIRGNEPNLLTYYWVTITNGKGQDVQLPQGLDFYGAKPGTNFRAFIGVTLLIFTLSKGHINLI